MHRVGIASKRLDICYSIVHPAVIAREAPLIGGDIRVTSGTVCMIIDRFSGTTLAAATRDVLSTDLAETTTKTAASLSSCRLLHSSEASTIEAHIGVSTSAICVVDLCSACAS